MCSLSYWSIFRTIKYSLKYIPLLLRREWYSHLKAFYASLHLPFFEILMEKRFISCFKHFQLSKTSSKLFFPFSLNCSGWKTACRCTCGIWAAQLNYQCPPELLVLPPLLVLYPDVLALYPDVTIKICDLLCKTLLQKTNKNSHLIGKSEE